MRRAAGNIRAAGCAARSSRRALGRKPSDRGKRSRKVLSRKQSGRGERSHMVPRPTRREEEGRKLRREGNGLCSTAGVKRDPGRLEHAGKGEGSEIRTADCRSEKKGKRLRRGKCHPFGLRRRLPFLMRVGRATSRGAPQGAEARSATVGRDTGRRIAGRSAAGC